jgi:hypothetical protein
VVDASELKAEGDVAFDWTGATRLKAAFEAMASAVETQRGARMSAFDAGLKGWQGAGRSAYDQKPRHMQGDTDAGELGSALRDAIADIEALERAAREENDRRRRAREWLDAYAKNEREENFGDNLHDFFFGEDFRPPPMPEPPHPEPNLVPPPGPSADPRV